MSFTVTGDVSDPSSFDRNALAALPQATQTDTFTSGGKPVTDTFTGPTLQNVLTASGGIKTNPAIKNDVLRHYIVVTGADGYKVVVSAGEIAPRFGNKQDLTAISDTKGQLPGNDGVARLTSPGDKAGGRYVSQITNVQVSEAPEQQGTGGGRTSSFDVRGHVSNPQTDNLQSLQSLTAYTTTATYTAGSTPVTDTYTGALLWDVLRQSDIITDPIVKNDILRDYVVATGSDGYQVVFSLGELSPTFGNEGILVAYSDTDGQLGPSGSSGFARLVVPGDIAGGRYVSNLASLTVYSISAVPLPSSSPLFGAALVALAGLGYGVKRKKATAVA